MPRDIESLVAALRSYQQADAEGIMVRVHRQACDEAADALDMLAEKKAPEWLTDVIAEGMVKHGPDGHHDGCEIIALMVWEALKDA